MVYALRIKERSLKACLCLFTTFTLFLHPEWLKINIKERKTLDDDDDKKKEKFKYCKPTQKNPVN